MSIAEYRDLCRSGRRRPGRTTFGPAISILSVLVAFALIVFALLWSQGVSSGLAPLVAYVVLAWVGSVWWIERRGAGGIPRRVLAKLRAVNRCGCAYDLAGLQPGADGMICCPECGARWKAPASSPN